MMKLIFNYDGSIKTITIPESIQQGNNGVNQVYVEWDGHANSNYTCSALFTLPDESVNELVGVVYEGGYLITLTSAQTIYAGKLKATFYLTDLQNNVLFSYQYTFQVNPTNADADETLISISQYNSILQAMNSYVLSSVVATVNGNSLLQGGNVVVSPDGTITFDGTTGAEFVSDGDITLNVATRDTMQTFTASKTFQVAPTLFTGEVNYDSFTFVLPNKSAGTSYGDKFDIRVENNIDSSNDGLLKNFLAKYGIGTHLVNFKDYANHEVSAYVSIYCKWESSAFRCYVKIQEYGKKSYVLYKTSGSMARYDLENNTDSIANIWNVANSLVVLTLNYGTAELVANVNYVHSIYARVGTAPEGLFFNYISSKTDDLELSDLVNELPKFLNHNARYYYLDGGTGTYKNIYGIIVGATTTTITFYNPATDVNTIYTIAAITDTKTEL